MRKTEQSLIELVKKHSHIIDYILDVIIQINVKGKFVHLSPQVCDMVGFRPEELIGLSVYQFLTHFYKIFYFIKIKRMKFTNPIEKLYKL